ncbi:Bacterial Ig-like domain (group 2) [compost metagenome]
MAYENSAGLNVTNHYGPRETGGGVGVFKTEGYSNQMVIDGPSQGLVFLSPRGDGVWITGHDYTFATGTVTSVTIGGIEVSGATDAAPIRLFKENTGEVVVTGLTAGKVVLFYKNVAGDKDDVYPAVANDGGPAVLTVVTLPASDTIAVAEQLQLTTVATPAEASQVFTYTSSDPTKATVNAQGVVTGVAAGATTITVRAVNDYTKFDTVAITVA